MYSRAKFIYSLVSIAGIGYFYEKAGAFSLAARKQATDGNTMIHPAMRAYQAVSETAISGRDADAACFRLLVVELEKARDSTDPAIRNAVLDKHQKMWGLIMRANISETGAATPQEDRDLFIRLADQAQRCGIQILLDRSRSLDPLIEIAQNVLDGLEGTPVTASAISYDIL
ncbi:MAG: flagellar biosynthesis regulator FlaF [Acetobacter papayae]|uniref:flagellar biosynthesis regulator FlaF n=1 Tax=Acetobacter papayae TaxID=1076592 RepID=UPI0039E99161